MTTKDLILNLKVLAFTNIEKLIKDLKQLKVILKNSEANMKNFWLTFKSIGFPEKNT